MTLITVIGRGHSGTRAISQTLANSGVYMGEPLNNSWDLIPAEEMYDACRIFAKYVDWTPGWGVSPTGLEGRSFNWSWKRALECEIPEAFKRRLFSFLHTVLESKAELKGWKIPETTLCFPWISRLFPDAKYIFWIRNPRDCIVGSHVTDDLNTFGIPYDRIYSQRGKRALSWLYQYNLVQSTPKPKNWIEVRLEDFVLKQEETLKRLEEFLGIPLVRIPVKPEVIGRWIADEEATDEDPNYFPFLEPAMREYGYEVPKTYKTAFHFKKEVNYDEAKMPAVELPDILTFKDGSKVTEAAQWPARRKEILDLLSDQEYGFMPQGRADVKAELRESGSAFGGKAIREQVRLTLSRDTGDGVKSSKVDVLIYRPAKAQGKVPAFVGLNFYGNHIVAKDEAIFLPDCWLSNSDKYSVKNGVPSEAGRGVYSDGWSPELIVDNGFALVTACYNELDPDYPDCFHNGVHPLYQDAEWTKPAPNEWATIGAWAWGLSRILDYLETTSWVNPKQVSVIGHSRLGKTALWAGANDERFAIAYSVQSGCGGAALSKRCIGETVDVITNAFPHWFCQNFRQYANAEATLPFDQHFLLALMAPRHVYVSSASEDHWADPKGEFLALAAADKAFNLVGLPGLGTDKMPEPEDAVGASNGYHIHSGPHAVFAVDWERYIAFAKRQFGME
ncbi:MAG: sulfotransferase [Victivallales bacterium]|nr:sulfotransferase [Victivallales bacterium]